MDLFQEAVENLFDRDKNPTGTFTLNIAENKLAWGLLKYKVQQITGYNEIPGWVASYTSGKGSPTFRAAAAHFLEKHLFKCPVDPECLAFSAGATSVIETTALVLGDEGDVVAFPAPNYPVYKQDIGSIAQLERYDIITHHDLSSLQDGPVLNLEHLQKAKKAIEQSGKKWKVLVLTNPDNPTGGMYSYEQLFQITDWCLKENIHLIVNEIYGLSLIDIQHPALKTDYSKQYPFVSFAQIMAQKQSKYLHLWYSFSKDFGISGFRVGLVYSFNEAFISAYENLNYGHLVSNHTQWILEMVLQDEVFLSNFIAKSQELLTEVYVVVVEALRQVAIPYVPSRGSLFIWLDLSEFLPENTQAAEDALWLELYQQTGILLTPGYGFGHSKKGHFRLVYPNFEKQDVVVAMNRFVQFVEAKRRR